MPDLFDPTERNMVLIESQVLHEAEGFVGSCEHCNPIAELLFDWILDELTGSDPTVTDYILEQPAKCPKCRHAILEKTFVEPV